MSDLSRRIAGLSPEKRALLNLRLAQERGAAEPVAVIGIGCRLPGADGPDAYWRLLREGRDAVVEVPADRWDAEALYDADPATPGKMRSRWGGFLPRVDGFDPLFFGISPREAVQMDPQQRLILEVAWEALEDAGQLPERLMGSRSGVFIGIMTGDYSQTRLGDLARVDAYTGTGNAYCLAANRISYQLGFTGPSLAVDSACSSSLVAVHLACQSLRSGESTLALAGGVNVILWPGHTIYFSKAGLMAADGRCKAFDASADGIVRGEGAGVVVLKPLARALADGDPIHAVIRGSAVNQDGRSNGLTAPSRAAQEAVLREAYRQAGVVPGRVRYVEAHGTGTALGDPIEAKALGTVLAEGREPGDLCRLGSAKTNLGHLEAAAGIAGLLKVVLSLRHRELPPSLHFTRPNPEIPFDSLGLAVQRELSPWPEGQAVAGVSSFGFGGTNAHVVVEEWPDNGTRADREEGGRPLLLPLSAHGEAALQATARAWRDLLASGEREPLPDLAYTAARRRSHREWRLAVTGDSAPTLVARLDAFLAGEAPPGLAAGRGLPGRVPKLAFVFCGQGPQWWGMGRELLAAEPVFREVMERCDGQVRHLAGWSLLAELSAPEESSRLDQTAVAQPCLFALQAALADLWRSRGVAPDGVVGHSVGEIAAAYVAGVLDLDEAVRVSVERGRLMQPATGRGRMAAVGLPFEEAGELLRPYEGRLAVAAVNGPRSTVLSGEAIALEEVLAGLERRGVFCRRLPVDYAFHSPQMDPVEEVLARSLADLAPRRPGTVTAFSTVDGGPADPRYADARYWGRNVRRPVRFAEAIDRMLDEGYDTFLEIGPHPVLAASISQCLEERGTSGSVLPSLRRQEPEREVMLSSLGALWASGCSVDWSGLYPSGCCVRLPAQAWQRERFWLEGTETRPATPETDGHPLLGRRTDLAHPAGSLVWAMRLDRRTLPYLEDHRIGGEVLVPATAYLEMALAAAERLFGPGPRALARIGLRKALRLPDAGTVELQLVLSPAEGGAAFQVFSRSADVGPKEPWTLHVRGQVREAAPAVAPPTASPEEIAARCPERRSGAEHYGGLARRGNIYGPAFQGIASLSQGRDEALGEVAVPAVIATELPSYHLHPALLDSCLQVLAAPLSGLEEGSGPLVPVGIGEVLVHAPLSGPVCWSHARIDRPSPPGGLPEARVSVLDASGRLVAELAGIRVVVLQGAPRHALPAAAEVESWLYEVAWRPAPKREGRRPAQSTGSWLILADADGLGEALAERLRCRGERSVLVVPGEGFASLGEDRFQVRPEDLGEMARLVAGHPWRGAVHLWALDALLAGDASPSDLETAHARVCGSALLLAQALARSAGGGSPRLWLVTRGAQRVGDERVSISQAPLWGLGRVVAREHPELWGGLVDLPPDPSGDDAAVLAAEVLERDTEDQVAWRDGHRHAARLAPAGTAATHPSPAVRPDAAYLITGGLGALGLQVAGWLVERGARHLALAGRSSPSGSAREVLDRLEREGVRLMTAQADVSRRGDVERLLAEVREALPPLRGVVHAAAVVDDGALLRQSRERFARVFAPKTLGAWNLHLATLGLPLDFFVLFSSAAALLGNPGQGSYAAANAFLDALAQHRRALGLPALSLGWGPWEGAGLATAVSDAARRRWAEHGIGLLRPRQALAVLERGMADGRGQLAALRLDGTKLAGASAAPFLAEVSGKRAEPLHDETSGAPAGLARRLATVPVAVRRDLLGEHVRAEIGRVLHLAPGQIEPRRGLFDLGMDSILALELRQRLEAVTERPLPATLVFDHSTAEGLVDFLARDVFQWDGAERHETKETAEPQRAQRVEELETLSEEQLAEMLSRKIAALKERRSG